MSGTFIEFTPAGIAKYYNQKKMVHMNSDHPELVTDNRQLAAQNLRLAAQEIDSSFSWHDIKTVPLEQQKLYWTIREWMFSQVLVLAYLDITSGKASRQPPKDFHISDHNFSLFGSVKPTSDIDVSVEGPNASYVISVLEDLWISVTGDPCSRWDIEYYGDFSTVLDDSKSPAFLNSREFNSLANQLFPFVGASILRNTGTLEFPELDEFVKTYSSRFPELAQPYWKQEANTLYSRVKNMDYNQQREEYYHLLSKAESIRNSTPVTSQDLSLKIFLAMCEANLYRSENYVLPSTVIHIVRDIQAGSPKANQSDPRCKLYHARLASCALGGLTYLCSAMEQLGYMKRFSYDPAKVAKYKERLDEALSHIGMSGGRRRKASRKTHKRRRIQKRKSHRRRV